MRIRHLLTVAMMMVLSGLAVATEGVDCSDGCRAPNAVPEPEMLALLGVGAVALFIARRRKKK